ncbi:hypothetical protein PYK79_45420 [Streptomyces sp. ID05-04B]|uniref:hypothetical protein n=1 Tax=Streptomyces sp. ID05-04B TaxID=3028661 RepID=UPI0029C45231|nr:hypothetical protein [Streptomyces sp. ID05-04B]MDX5569071.1 hypothetical protein [Streptomyces sp. ID05-04B]
MTAVAATGAGMTAQAATGITPARFADGAVTVDFLARTAMHSAYGLAIVSATVLAVVTTVARRRERRSRRLPIATRICHDHFAHHCQHPDPAHGFGRRP